MKIILMNFNLREDVEESGFSGDLTAFACNAKSFGKVFLFFLSFFIHSLSGRTDKSTLCLFFQFLI